MSKLIVLSVLSFVASSLASSAPVLIWSSNRALSDLPQSYAGKTIKKPEFAEGYLSPLTNKGNLVVFLQDKLSLQDFTQHADVYNPDSDGGAFKNVKRFMDDLFSVSLPSVLLPGDSIRDLMKNFNGKVHQIKDSAEIDNLDLGVEQKNLIIVTLKPVLGKLNEEEAFGHNDNMIGDVIKRLSKRSADYMAVYTAHNSQKVQFSELFPKRRLLTVEPKENGTLVNETCMFAYFQYIQLFVDKNGKNTTLNMNDTLKFKSEKSMCTNNTAVIHLIYNDTQVSSLEVEITINIAIGNNTDFWNVTETLVNVMGNSTFEGEAYLDMGKVTAPATFSYHCSSLGPIRNVKKSHSEKNSTINATLTFSGFQVQPFNIMDNQFSEPWDCVPFFTSVIWMGLLAVALWIVILLYGFTMLAGITTMDRFDDPKGKTITVNVSE